MKTESVSAAAGSAQSVAGVIRHAERSAEVKLAVVPQDLWWKNRPCVSFHSYDAAINSQLENTLTKRESEGAFLLNALLTADSSTETQTSRRVSGFISEDVLMFYLWCTPF